MSTANRVLGVDVSVYQDRPGKTVDWSAVAASGVRFAIIRASDGHRVDPTASEHIENLAMTDMHFGIYQLLRPGTPLKVHQAIVGPLMELAASAGDRVLPPTVDFEKVGSGWSDGVSAEVNCDALQAWIEWVEDRYTVSPIIYTGPAFWAEFMKAAKPSPTALATFARCPLWLADYNNRHPDSLQVPVPWTEITIWQFTNRGVIPGVPSSYDTKTVGGLDLNLYLSPHPLKDRLFGPYAGACGG